jgi:hypothetical protein
MFLMYAVIAVLNSLSLRGRSCTGLVKMYVAIKIHRVASNFLPHDLSEQTWRIAPL